MAKDDLIVTVRQTDITKRKKWVVRVQRLVVEQAFKTVFFNDPSEAIGAAIDHEFEEDDWRREYAIDEQMVISIHAGDVEYSIVDAGNDGFRCEGINFDLDGLERCDQKELNALVFAHLNKAEEEVLRKEAEKGMAAAADPKPTKRKRRGPL